jgi:anti-sigma-K factor RskA
MSPQEREELELQASEYALGSLSGDERLRFERILAEEPWLQQRVDEWNRRLGPLAEALAPVAPSPAVWSNIEARIAGDRAQTVRVSATPSLWNRVAFWRWTAIAGVAIAALLVFYIAAGPTSRPYQIAVLTNQQGSPAMVVSTDAGGHELTVNALAAAPAGHTHELWVIAPGQNPRSLGTVTAAGPARLQIPPDIGYGLHSKILAVSLEPAGGSPTGQPTGPVIYTGQVIAVN